MMAEDNIIKLGDNCELDLNRLIDTRLLVQANSGGGKSWLLRKLMEESHGKVQHIILDLEGEFSTLREKYDYLIIGKEGDIPIEIKSASLLVKKLLEFNISTIIDLYELKHHERILYVKKFLDAMINVPKNLWHPCLVVVDEAHVFCPEKGKSEAMNSVIELCTRGRKRGFCGVLATQRLSKLNKDAAAECNNKLIGRTGLDVDMKRAGDELGFNSKEQYLSLRRLEAGSFFSFGTALSTEVKKIKIGKVKTQHPRSGNRQFVTTPQPTSKIKSILNNLIDINKEAEIELNEIEDYKKEIRRLRLELTKSKNLNLEKEKEQSHKQGYLLGLKENKSTTKIERIKTNADEILSKILKIMTSYKSDDCENIPNITNSNKNNYEIKKVNLSNGSGATRMLKAIAMFYPNGITKQRIGAIAGLSHKSGTFGTYLSSLRNNGFIESQSNEFICTEKGLQEAGDFEPLPSDPETLINMWASIVKGGAGRMLLALGSIYPSKISKDELGEKVGLISSSGTFGTYLSTLRRNDLIDISREGIRLSDEIAGGTE